MPDNNGPFVAQTIAYSGTGSTAAPAGDGTRDVLLGADNVHPTPAGSMALGQYEASAIRSILAAL
jgi:phospholipase/lecithinase/hemolysin